MNISVISLISRSGLNSIRPTGIFIILLRESMAVKILSSGISGL
jgi:hypothetical protein